MPKRKTWSAEMKARIATEAIKGQQTINQLASQYGVHPNQINIWKRQALDELPRLFSRRREKEVVEDEDLKAQLYQQIGQLKVELDWLKKKSGILP